jgi:RNA polymerase sigma-70 factor (ECF subfamily)
MGVGCRSEAGSMLFMNFGGGLEINSKPTDPDLVLVGEFASGQADAFDRLFERYSSYVYNTCLSIIGDPDDARDAMQDTFVQLYRSLPKFRGQSKFSTWLYRITVNKCRDRLRARPRWESTDSLEWVAEPDGEESDGLLEEQVRQTMMKLKADYRTVLALYYFQQLSYDEIAECLGCSLDLVRIRLHRARKAFRLAYGDGGGEVEV